MVGARALLAAFAVAAAAGTARADTRLASRGPFAEGGIGALVFLSSGGGESAGVGPSFAIRAGYDLFSFFSVGVRVDMSMHEAQVPPPPAGEYFQLYTGAAEGRLGFNVWRLGIFAEGGAGGSYISTNILEKVDVLEPGESFTLMFTAGGGVEYQLQNRHYALGIAGAWSMYPEFGEGSPLSAITTRGYLRYTY